LPSDRLTTTEAVCRLCWHLLHGEGLTTKQAQKLIGFRSRSAVWTMLSRMSGPLPIVQERGVWMLMEKQEPGDGSQGED
jgi:hypothetical protein